MGPVVWFEWMSEGMKKWIYNYQVSSEQQRSVIGILVFDKLLNKQPSLHVVCHNSMHKDEYKHLGEISEAQWMDYTGISDITLDAGMQ